MSGTNSISAITRTSWPQPVITVEHPDGRISHIPVVLQDRSLVARVPTGAKIIDIAPERTT